MKTPLKGKARSFHRAIEAAVARAQETGEHQWIAFPRGASGAFAEAWARYAAERPVPAWLRGCAWFSDGVRVEVLDSYRAELAARGAR
jgi:hypothetical protein